MSFSDRIRKVRPYTPGEQPREEGVIKLNTNECPYPPAPGVTEALSAISARELALYPDPEAGELKDALSEVYGLPRDRIFVGVGSDEVLGFVFLTFFGGNEPLLFPEPTYSFYPVWAELYGIPYKPIPLREGFRMDPSDYRIPNGGIIFPNPNAPTGVLEPTELIEKLLKENPESLVVVDEAYIDFSSEEFPNPASALKLLSKYENLLVVQTFSKSRALAGMRIGMAFGSREVIRALSDVKYSFNSYTMSRAAIKAGAAAARDGDYLSATVKKVVETREQAKVRLKALGFSFPDSGANFLFARPPKGNAKEVFEALRERKIYVRYFAGPVTGEYLRITIGRPEQMEALYAALEEIIS